MATWSGWAEIKSRLVTAGGNCTPAIISVARGRPSGMPTVDAIRFWVVGSAPGLAVFGASQRRINFEVAVLLRAAPESVEAEGRLDERAEEADEAVRSALSSGFALAGAAIDFDIGDTATAVENWPGGNLLVVNIAVSYLRSSQIAVTA